MKRAMAVTMVAWMLASQSATGGTEMPQGEAEVLHQEHAFIAAWNAGDAHGAAALYAEDGVRVGAFGDVQRGRKDIEAAYEKLFHGPLRGAMVEWVPGVRLLTGEVALAEGPMTIRPVGGAPAMRGYALDVWKKTSAGWQLVEGHPKFFPPALAPPQTPSRPDSP